MDDGRLSACGGDSWNSRNKDGSGVLHVAAIHREKAGKMVQQALNGGADLECKDKRGITPLMVCVQQLLVLLTFAVPGGC